MIVRATRAVVARTRFAGASLLSVGTGRRPRSAIAAEIVDTQDQKYAPVQLDQKTNPLVYRPGFNLPAASIFPPRDTLGDQSFAQGGLLLFKIRTSSNQNRPLVLHISNTQGTFEGEVDLDV